MSSYFLLILILHFIKVRGDYILSVQVHLYNNPTNRCVGCGDDFGCCDRFREDVCTDELRCDNEFFYCLRPLRASNLARQDIMDTVGERSLETRATTLQCLESPAAIRTDTDTDAASRVFSGVEYLGIDNPMMFEVTAKKWEGIQLYADVIDRDGPGNSDELVESFSINLEPERLAPGLDLQLVTVNGTFGFASTVLSFQLECQPGFIRESCVEISQICTTDPCSNNGTCIQSATGFTCACTGDFTGDTCETRIDNCEGVDCNSGTCVDGVETFTCQCAAGYSGDLCEVTTTTSSSSVMTTTTTITSSSNSVVAGAVGGSVVFIIIIIIIIIIIVVSLMFVFMRQRVHLASSKGTMDNPVYDTSGLSGGQDKDVERDLDNPIYGLEDNPYDMPEGHLDTIYTSISIDT